MIETEAPPDFEQDFLDEWQSEQAARLARIKLNSGHSVTRIAPHEGKQMMFNTCPADIAWYGGAAGGGKSFLLLFEVIRHIFNMLFRGVIFRRTYKQITQPGGLWDTAQDLYARCSGQFNQSGMFCRWPSGARMNFSHMQLEKHKQDWDGSQIALALWDELFHFTETQYVYVTFSRARSLSGVRSYSRAGLNPDPDGWTRVWVDPYIGSDGWPLPHMAGVILYFYRDGNDLVWGKNPDELKDKYPKATKNPYSIKSYSFIPASLEDNLTLQELDPAYAGNIDALPHYQQQRLKGNWNIRANAGSFFQRHYFTIIDLMPNNIVAVIRHWDFAATAPSEENPNPDWLRGGLYGITRSGYIVTLDMKSARVGPADVEKIFLSTAELDREVWGSRYTVGFEREPASMSKVLAEIFSRKLRGFKVWINRPDGSKEMRALPVATYAKNVGIYLMRGPWNGPFIEECYNFPVGPKDDQVDTLSGAFLFLTSGKTRDLSGYQ